MLAQHRNITLEDTSASGVMLDPPTLAQHCVMALWCCLRALTSQLVNPARGWIPGHQGGLARFAESIAAYQFLWSHLLHSHPAPHQP